MPSIDVSLIVTVYNKERYLPATVRSLLQQRENSALNMEYVFVDDVSTDGSLQVIEELTRGLPDTVVVRNTHNAGPSIRLNQGARVARGEYLQFLDSDDILAANATRVMHRLLKANNADVIHGQWERSSLGGEALLGRRIAEKPAHEVSDSPLLFVLRGRFLRMAQMCSREVFMQAGGADERVFIQDESLPLRLSACAGRFIALRAPLLLIPQVEGQLSSNKSQLNHDRFLANYFMLQDKKNLAEEARQMLFERCVSAAWKQARSRGLAGYFSRDFSDYLKSRAGFLKEDANVLKRMKKEFLHLSNVRRVAEEGAFRAV